MTTTGFQYNGLDLASILAPAISGADNNNTMTNYTTNSNPTTFLKPFITSTDTTAANLTPDYKYSYNSTGNSLDPLLFCPAYKFYGNSQAATTYTSGNLLTKYYSYIDIPNLVKKMFVVLVGGGGGGGGGGARKGGGASGGGGGGGGGINAYWVTYVSSVTQFNCSAGYGGNYGQPSSNTGLAPATNATNGSNVNGQTGTAGANSVFTYNGIDYSAQGGSSGSGGGTSTSTGGGGAGGAVGTGIYSTAGANGAASPYTGYQNTAGGNGGNPGNLNTTNTSGYLINPGLINMISLQIGAWNNSGHSLPYGQGGYGGNGDSSSNYGSSGQYGAPGCVIVFFYY